MPHKSHRYPSVTQILGILAKPHLYRWYGTLGFDECEKIKRESADNGTRVHEEVSQFLKTGVSVEGIAERFCSEYPNFNRKPVEVEPEEPYESKKYKYSGTFDWIEKDPNGELVVADLKVTNQMYPEMGLQLAAYANLYNEKHGTKINKGRIYRIDKKTGRVQVKDFDNLKESFKVFKSLIPVYRWLYK